MRTATTAQSHSRTNHISLDTFNKIDVSDDDMCLLGFRSGSLWRCDCRCSRHSYNSPSRIPSCRCCAEQPVRLLQPIATPTGPLPFNLPPVSVSSPPWQSTLQSFNPLPRAHLLAIYEKKYGGSKRLYPLVKLNEGRKSSRSTAGACVRVHPPRPEDHEKSLSQ